MVSNPYEAVLDEILRRAKSGLDFRSAEVAVPANDRKSWIRMRIDPPRFSASMFLGVWSIPNKHPTVGELRILHAIELPDHTVRLIARQGKFLYVKIYSVES
jgi:hypothetical protein